MAAGAACAWVPALLPAPRRQAEGGAGMSAEQEAPRRSSPQAVRPQAARPQTPEPRLPAEPRATAPAATRADVPTRRAKSARRMDTSLMFCRKPLRVGLGRQALRSAAWFLQAAGGKRDPLRRRCPQARPRALFSGLTRSSTNRRISPVRRTGSSTSSSRPCRQARSRRAGSAWRAVRSAT